MLQVHNEPYVFKNDVCSSNIDRIVIAVPRIRQLPIHQEMFFACTAKRIMR